MDPLPHDAIAVSVRRAAELIGCSKSQLYKEYVWPGLLSTVQLGARGGSILVAELNAAVKKRIEEQRADPNFKRTVPAQTAPGAPGQGWRKGKGKKRAVRGK
jgi:hypothetical protein